LLYHIVKPIIRLALLLFCRKIYINRHDYFNMKGPLILAVNHPNSFLDAVLAGVFFKQPVHFLARGDAFKKSWALKILASLKCIPVYRLREGREYLHLNDDTFERCRAIFKKGGIVLIFSEGLCINEWNLRPLRKGTARLAWSAWNDAGIGDTLRILPVGISYNSFNRLPKQVFLNFGSLIERAHITQTQTTGAAYQQINQLLTAQLLQGCFTGIPNQPVEEAAFAFAITNAPQVNAQPFEALRQLPPALLQPENMALLSSCRPEKRFYCAISKRRANQSLVISVISFLPALAGLAGGYWFYLLAKQGLRRTKMESGHYDSMMFVLLALFYPLAAGLVAGAAWWITGKALVFIALLVLQPVSGWLLTVFHQNWQQFWNFNKLNNQQKISLQRFFETHLKQKKQE
jgi:1-acyl-sn-glycerol-3-phosphate acyltransferase